jgi:hypothetical protein
MAQIRRSSHGTGGTDSRGSERSSTGSLIEEILMLLHPLAASTSTGVVGYVTQSSALTGSATVSQSSTSGPPSTHSLGTCTWYLDSGTSFHMTPHSTHLSSMHPSYHHLTIQIANGSPLSIAG